MTIAFLFFLALGSAENCSCVAAFDALIETVESNYLGFHLDDQARARYERAKITARRVAGRTPPERCYRVLQDLVAEFHDGHLFVIESPELSPEEKEARATNAPRVEWDEERARTWLEKRRGRLDPIEGFWYSSDGSRYAIIPKPAGKRNEFVAFVLSTSNARWRTGDIKASFTRLRDDSYDVTYFTRDRAALHPAHYMRGRRGGGVVRNDVLLHMAPHTWGREGSPLLDPENPRAPTFRMIGDDLAVFFIPSHAPEHRMKLEALVKKHHADIIGVPTLMIDIRGNEGGSSTTTRALEPYYLSPAGEPRQPDRSVVLASEANIEIFKEMATQGWPPAELIERLEANRGKIVPLTPRAEPQRDEAADAMPMPRHVAILIDEGVVSAGEAFTARARRHTKVTVFGENTGGMIDYQIVRGWKRVGCERYGLTLGYPIIAASPDLPDDGVNATGMAPDIRIPPGSDPFTFIVRHFRRKGTAP